MAGVLIADDHAPTRAQIRGLLESRCILVCGEAADGEETLAKLKQLDPSIVLLDVYMPKLNGFAAAREIRRIAPATNIIFFTNHDGGRRSTAVARALGAIAWIDKGTGAQEFLVVVESCLPRAHDADRAAERPITEPKT